MMDEVEKYGGYIDGSEYDSEEEVLPVYDEVYGIIDNLKNRRNKKV